MAKNHPAAVAGTATARAVEPIAESIAPSPAARYEQIATLAYQYWLERGCPIGSPEEDRLRAEVDLQRQTTGT